MAKLMLRNSHMFIFFVILFFLCFETHFSDGRQDKFIDSQQKRATKQDLDSNSTNTLCSPPNEGNTNTFKPTPPGHSPGVGHSYGPKAAHRLGAHS
ncbi:hypothetical protein CASFOL_030332 [Castilleja foliolosa]|uniref:Transmembrane protein n=1 Tax=Castilleja foliolosa TaxID=1961234 RepID=A0ABD3C8F5_9LAMI